jgi:hypothetical protein
MLCMVRIAGAGNRLYEGSAVTRGAPSQHSIHFLGDAASYVAS